MDDEFLEDYMEQECWKCPGCLRYVSSRWRCSGCGMVFCSYLPDEWFCFDSKTPIELEEEYSRHGDKPITDEEIEKFFKGLEDYNVKAKKDLQRRKMP